MAITGKNITDDILRILTRFNFTDDSRFKINWIKFKRNEIREQLILQEYSGGNNQNATNNLDRAWFSNLGKISFIKVNAADDPNINFCCDNYSKATLPQIISLTDRNSGNLDLGLTTVMSACGTMKYFPYSLSLWSDVPSEHTRSLFRYFDRIGNVIYVNKLVDYLYFPQVLLLDYTNGVIKQSDPIASGSIATGISYVVRYANVVYNGITYTDGQTFVGVVSVTTFSTITGKVYLMNNQRQVTENDPYPVSGTMARNIVLEILTKEFSLEAQQVNDILNDSKDDNQQAVQVPSKQR